MKKIIFELKGVLAWTELRENIILMLNKSKTERQFLDIIEALIFATGSIDTLIEKRKSLGLNCDDLLRFREGMLK